MMVNPKTISRISVVTYPATTPPAEGASTWESGETLTLAAIRVVFADGGAVNFMPLDDRGNPQFDTTGIDAETLLDNFELRL